MLDLCWGKKGETYSWGLISDFSQTYVWAYAELLLGFMLGFCLYLCWIYAWTYVWFMFGIMLALCLTYVGFMLGLMLAQSFRS